MVSAVLAALPFSQALDRIDAASIAKLVSDSENQLKVQQRRQDCRDDLSELQPKWTRPVLYECVGSGGPHGRRPRLVAHAPPFLWRQGAGWLVCLGVGGPFVCLIITIPCVNLDDIKCVMVMDSLYLSHSGSSLVPPCTSFFE